jgi:integrase
MKFTESNIKTVPIGETRDSATTGLVLRVSPKGKRVFNFLYRQDGKLTRINIGTYPAITLTEARQAVLTFRTNIDSGKPPQAISGTGLTISQVYHEWIVIKRRSVKRPEVIESIFNNHLLPTLGNYAVTAITPQPVIVIANKLIDRGISATAGIAIQTLKELLNHAVMAGYIPVNPIMSLSGSKLGIKKKSIDRVLTINELKTIWNTSYDGLIGPMLKVLMLTFCRGSEIRCMEWDWVDFDNRTITFPKDVMKMGISHSVYMVDTVIDILKYQEQFKIGKYVWISGYEDKLLPRTYIPIATGYLRTRERMDHWTAHSLRRNVTYLADMGIGFDTIEALLAHKIPGIAGVYNRSTLSDQRKEALIKWEQFILTNCK